MWAVQEHRREPPPRTRGSTPAGDDTAAAPPASPAYAGIDLIQHPIHRIVDRLPRVRGDRPKKPARLTPDGLPPPRTRGSTRPRSWATGCGRASPAYAGIDPWITWNGPWAASLPRVRGDRPAQAVHDAILVRPPPRTRGSTRPVQENRRGGGASPAYAGIDPSPPRTQAVSASLPRVRGDRPAPHDPRRLRRRPPPRTRGSTRRGRYR